MTSQYKFHNRKQGQNESISDFDIALRKCAVNCQFTNLEEALCLCDRLVLGLKEVNIQRELLNKNEDLTYVTALQMALTLEVVHTECEQLHENTVVDPVKTE